MNKISHRQQDRLEKHIHQDCIVNNELQITVLKAILNIPRHLFIDSALKGKAYDNTALPIGHQQTISQPSIVAIMTAWLYKYCQHQSILEIGTGSGYQSAILSQLWQSVYTIERKNKLQEKAKINHRTLKLNNIHYLFADGSQGWQEKAPFSAIMITAKCDKIPDNIFLQIADGGSIIAPIGNNTIQELILYQHTIEQGITHWKKTTLSTVQFVPLLNGTE